MKVHFTKIERAAGLFVLVAFAGFFLFTVVVAIKQGWFSPRLHLKTFFNQGEGLHPGTLVQISGLRAGTVDSVHLNDENRIEVRLSLNNEFSRQIKTDSVARVIRPFIIGDKVVEVTVGSKEALAAKEGSELGGEETTDIMDMMGGGKLGPYLNTIDNLLKNIQVVAEAFADPKRSKALIGMFDQALPTMVSLRELSMQATKDKNLAKSMENLSVMLPQMVEFSKHLPELGNTSAKTMEQLSLLTTELNKFLPIFTAIAPKLPEASQNGIDALKEAVVVLKAMQKSFLLKGAVKDVKDEEAAKERMPANK